MEEYSSTIHKWIVKIHRNKPSHRSIIHRYDKSDRYLSGFPLSFPLDSHLWLTRCVSWSSDKGERDLVTNSGKNKKSKSGWEGSSERPVKRLVEGVTLKLWCLYVYITYMYTYRYEISISHSGVQLQMWVTPTHEILVWGLFDQTKVSIRGLSLLTVSSPVKISICETVTSTSGVQVRR